MNEVKVTPQCQDKNRRIWRLGRSNGIISLQIATFCSKEGTLIANKLKLLIYPIRDKFFMRLLNTDDILKSTHELQSSLITPLVYN